MVLPDLDLDFVYQPLDPNVVPGDFARSPYLVTVTHTEIDRLKRARDTINWFAGETLYGIAYEQWMQ